MAKKAPPALETALDNLENLVERMESGELTLEESLKAFEEGVRLSAIASRPCSQQEKSASAGAEHRCEPGLSPATMMSSSFRRWTPCVPPP